jgi:hypothetical protein
LELAHGFGTFVVGAGAGDGDQGVLSPLLTSLVPNVPCRPGTVHVLSYVPLDQALLAIHAAETENIMLFLIGLVFLG